MDINEVEMKVGARTVPKTEFIPEVHNINERTNNKETINQNGYEATRNNHKDEDTTEPLLSSGNGSLKPPLAEAEVDDLDRAPVTVSPFSIDDEVHAAPFEISDRIGDAGEGDEVDGEHHMNYNEAHDKILGINDGNLRGVGSTFGINYADSPVVAIATPDVNTYQQKKNLAQGMMDLALLSANANQLRYVLESNSSGHAYYYSSIVFISVSIILQVAVGVGLIINSRYDVKDEKEICKADKINNLTVLGIFLITIVNVFITSFSVAPTSTGVPPVTSTAVQQNG